MAVGFALEWRGPKKDILPGEAVVAVAASSQRDRAAAVVLEALLDPMSRPVISRVDASRELDTGLLPLSPLRSRVSGVRKQAVHAGVEPHLLGKTNRSVR